MEPTPDLYQLGLNFGIYASVVAMVCEAIIRSGATFFKQNPLGVRLVPSLPLLVGGLGALIPETIPSALQGPALFYGILAGGLSGQIYGFVKRQFTIAEKLAATKVQNKLEEALETNGEVVSNIEPQGKAENAQPELEKVEPTEDPFSKINGAS